MSRALSIGVAALVLNVAIALERSADAGPYEDQNAGAACQPDDENDTMVGWNGRGLYNQDTTARPRVWCSVPTDRISSPASFSFDELKIHYYAGNNDGPPENVFQCGGKYTTQSLTIYSTSNGYSHLGTGAGTISWYANRLDGGIFGTYISDVKGSYSIYCHIPRKSSTGALSYLVSYWGDDGVE